MMKFAAQAFLVAYSAAGASAASAATINALLPVKAVIVAECRISNIGTLNFGSIGLTTSNTDATATFSLQCTKSTAYEIGIDQGVQPGLEYPREMEGADDVLTYELYRDAARANRWGYSDPETLSGIGTGNAETIQVYGRIPAQTAPMPDDYEDFCTIVVNY
jgi:spore coat protein U-like protein